MIACTVMRGFNDAYGSWKTICIFARIVRRSRPDGASTSSPSNRTVPDVGSSSRRMQRPVVDFPQPDSPTSPSVSPRCTEKLTPETAWTSPTLCRNSPARIGKFFTRSFTSSTGAGTAGGRGPGPDSTEVTAPPPARRTRPPDSSDSRSAKWHADQWSAPTSRSSGRSRSQTPGTSAIGHRGWNAHPGGRKINDGGWPLIRCSRFVLSDRRSRRGSDASRPSAYGWRGS